MSDSALSPTVIHTMNHPLSISRDTDHATQAGSFRTTVFWSKTPVFGLWRGSFYDFCLSLCSLNLYTAVGSFIGFAVANCHAKRSRHCLKRNVSIITLYHYFVTVWWWMSQSFEIYNWQNFFDDFLDKWESFSLHLYPITLYAWQNAISLIFFILL